MIIVMSSLSKPFLSRRKCKAGVFKIPRLKSVFEKLRFRDRDFRTFFLIQKDYHKTLFRATEVCREMQ